MLNKKGQYYPRPSYEGLHPLLIIGIVLLVAPTISMLLGFKFGNTISNIMWVLGILGILVGSLLSIMNKSGGY